MPTFFRGGKERDERGVWDRDTGSGIAVIFILEADGVEIHVIDHMDHLVERHPHELLRVVFRKIHDMPCGCGR